MAGMLGATWAVGAANPPVHRAAPAPQALQGTASARRPVLDPTVQVAYLVDLSSGAELISRNADRRFVPASITKAMTLFVAFEMIRDGKLQADAQLPISDETFQAWNQKGSTMYIPAGSTVRVDDLLMGIANVSANDASIVLAEGAAGSIEGWVNRMNAAARQLGMRNTRFASPNGWPDEARTFTTARDLTLLSRAMVERHPRLYARYVGKPGFAFNGIAQSNHDPVSGQLEGADGIKTGFTRQAGHGFLGSAMRQGRRLVVVTAVSDTERARDGLARELLEWGFVSTRSVELFPAGTVVGEAMVQRGDNLSVPLVTGSLPVRLTLPLARAGERDVTLAIHYQGPLRAPVQRGEKVAELEISVEGSAPSRVPLFAQTAVGRASGLDRLINGLAGLIRW